MTNSYPRSSAEDASSVEAPLVSIVIPVYNDEDVIESALRSCLAQTLTDIEVIVVDDASTDGTAAVVERYVVKDSRVRLLRQSGNTSAYQARRTGILAARASHVLFVDGDDELVDVAAAVALDKAVKSGADLVQFGIEVVRKDGSSGGAFESRLAPRHDSLTGQQIVRELFPVGQPAQGQLWRYLFRTELLREAYSLMPEDLVLPRVNDLPITFLAVALAERFVSIPDQLYRYHFGRGGSGQKVEDLERARFYAGAINSIGTIAAAVSQIATLRGDSDVIRAAYESARLAIIGYTTHYLAEHTREDVLDDAFEYLYALAPPRDIVNATARFWPRALDTLAAHAPRIELGPRPARSVLLTTNILRTGGVSGVLLAQANALTRAGIQVTIAAREPGSDATVVPSGITFVEITGDDLADQLEQWERVCREHEIDVVVDHHWLYTTRWPAFALAAGAEGTATIGWAHNFAGRSILLGLDTIEFQRRHLHVLAHLVVLSPLDVAFWKLQGMPRVSYMPNPPSPMLLTSSVRSEAKPAPVDRPIELVWWGRLDQPTKRVNDLVEVASHLDRLGVAFHLRIIGPDWDESTAEKLNELARQRSLSDRVEAVGALYGDDLLTAIDSADVFVNTSIIEGYPLTIPEAQSRGLPVAMYELPWLTLARGNHGIVTAPQNDAVELAARIAEIAHDPAKYGSLSRASIAAARRERSHDFSALYASLFAGNLPTEDSAAPTIEDIKLLISLVIHFAEENSAVRTGPVANRAASSTPPARRGEVPLPALVRALGAIARALLTVAPWLKPAAFRIKHALLVRRHR